jgi:hypothetical protein
LSRTPIFLWFRKSLPTIVLWSLVTLLAAQKYGAMFAFLTLPFVVIYVLASIVFLFFRKQTLGNLGGTLAVVSIAYLIVAAVHFARFKEARHDGDEVVQKIQAYRVAHGIYPGSSLEFGVSPEQLKPLRYALAEGEPMLFYPATQMAFDVYWYNFEQSVWEYRVD